MELTEEQQDFIEKMATAPHAVWLKAFRELNKKQEYDVIRSITEKRRANGFMGSKRMGYDLSDKDAEIIFSGQGTLEGVL